jgi:hypothetical protein
MAELITEFDGQGTTSDPDRALALHQARQLKSEVLKEFMRVLRIYTDLVVHRIVPKEDPDDS